MIRPPKTFAMLLLAAALVVCAPACGKKSSGDDDDAPAKTAGTGSKTTVKKGAALTGKVAGSEWTVAAARAIPTVDDDATQPYTIRLVSDKFDAACQESVLQGADKKSLEFLAKVDKTGEVALAAAAKFQFIDESGAKSKKVDAKSATLTIDTTTATTIKGKLTATADDDDTVTGTVSILKCCATEDGLAYQACTP